MQVTKMNTTATSNTVAGASRSVNVIPATKRTLQSGDQLRHSTDIRVAAYCRVSTDEESQQNSYASQKAYYTDLIFSHRGWTMAGIYADEGKSGTTRKSRINFNRMIDDAVAGKIDYIITKSISRFARNTVDSLDCVRELQRLSPPVGIYFERENIDTLNQNSEMFLTFYSSMAQEESRSISENIKWSLAKNMEKGKSMVNLDRMLGYDYGPDREWVINETQAATVYYIFNRFIQGASANGIAKELNGLNMPTVNGKLWRADSVLAVLRNEKYCGDLLTQKTFTESFLTHKAVKNTGEKKQYYIRGHHAPIVSRDVWEKTQAILDSRRYGGGKRKKMETEAGTVEIVEKEQDGRVGAVKSVFYGMSCSCGGKMKRMSYSYAAKNYSDERATGIVDKNGTEDGLVDVFSFGTPVWKCTGGITDGLVEHRDKLSDACGTRYQEISLEQSFMEMLYRIRRDIEVNGENAGVMKAFKKIYAALAAKEVNSGFIEQKLELIRMEIEKLDGAYRDAEKKRQMAAYSGSITLGTEARGAMGISVPGSVTVGGSGDIYERLANDLKHRLDEKKKEYRRLEEDRGMSVKAKANFDAFVKALEAMPETNPAGNRLNVNALDVDGTVFCTAAGNRRGSKRSEFNRGRLRITAETIDAAPDILPFEDWIIREFVGRITANGDEVKYTTNFGLTLTSIGNSRKLRAFQGYRKAKADGTVEFVAENWQIKDSKIWHRRAEPVDWKDKAPAADNE